MQFSGSHEEQSKQYKCPYCIYSAKRKDNLERHILIHTDIKPYECQFCQKSFRTLSNLKQHSVIHLK